MDEQIPIGTLVRLTGVTSIKVMEESNIRLFKFMFGGRGSNRFDVWWAMLSAYLLGAGEIDQILFCVLIVVGVVISALAEDLIEGADHE
jgi:hypothetical protein